MGMAPTISNVSMTENLMVGARPKYTPDNGYPPPNHREHVSVREVPSTIGHRVVSPVSTGHILGEGAVIFTDMTETMLTVLDQQMALLGEAQKPKGSLTSNILTPDKYLVVATLGNPKLYPRLLIR